MQAKKLTFNEGWNWLASGLVIYRKAPTALAMLTAAYWMVIFLVNAIPLAGPIIGSLIMPVLSVGMMNACRYIDRGEVGDDPRLDILFSAFLQSPVKLVVLGALYLGLTFLVLSVTTLIDGGTLMALMTGDSPAPEVLQRSEVLTAMQVALLLLAPIVAAYWYAPLLAAWHDVSIAKALFFSFVATARNWAAFLGYGLASFAFIFVLPTIVMGIVAGIVGNQTLLLMLVGIPVLLILAPSLLASFYVSFRDVFVCDDDASHVDINV